MQTAQISLATTVAKMKPYINKVTTKPIPGQKRAMSMVLHFTEGGSFQVEQTDELQMVLAALDSFVNKVDVTAEETQQATEQLEEAAAKPENGESAETNQADRESDSDNEKPEGEGEKPEDEKGDETEKPEGEAEKGDEGERPTAERNNSGNGRRERERTAA